MQATEAAINVCFNRQLASTAGRWPSAPMTILASVMQFAMLPLQGLTQGAQPITSYNYGAKNAARVRAASFRALFVSCMVYAGTAVAGSDALPARLRRPVQHRRGAYRLYRQSPARLHGRGRASSACNWPASRPSSPSATPKAPSSSPCCARSYCSSPSSTSFPPCCPWTRPWPCTSPSRWPTSSPLTATALLCSPTSSPGRCARWRLTNVH